MIGDLHCHTKISDGSLGIEDTIIYAKRIGLDFLAITDHDTTSGVTRAKIVGSRIGLGIVEGVEWSCVDTARGRKVHILCYLYKNADRLEGLSKRICESRTQATAEAFKKVQTFFPVTKEDLMKYAAGSKCLYKQHIMHLLMDFGYADQMYGPLYRKLFDPKEGSCIVRASYPDVHEVVDLIRQAGGVAVVAHPFEYDSFPLVEELTEKGEIDGVEVWHPRHSKEQVQLLTEFAREKGLLTTGGTDFHGMYSSRANPLSSYLTGNDDLKRLFAYKGRG